MSKDEKSVAHSMSITGSVERSLDQFDIALFIPETTRITRQTAQVNWYPKETASAYKVVITNMFDEEVYATTVSETQATIDFNAIGLEADDIYKMQVNASDESGAKSAIVTLRTPAEEEMNNLQSEYSQLEENASESALNELVLATYFEQNELYLNAIPHYERAIALEPEIEEYKEAYNRFLYSVGLYGIK
jgi:hypothetical protein